MADSSRNHAPAQLDWSKLLGFDQFTRPAGTADLQEPACAKVGLKPGPLVPHTAKVGLKPQTGLQVPNWAKVGAKL